MELNESKFNQMFLKNMFKEVLNEKGNYSEIAVNDMAENLAKIFETEFGSGNYPYKILSEHKNVESWMNEKIQNIS